MPMIYPHSPPTRYRTELFYNDQFMDYADGNTPEESKCAAQARYDRLRRLCGEDFLRRYPDPEGWSLRTFDRRPPPLPPPGHGYGSSGYGTSGYRACGGSCGCRCDCNGHDPDGGDA